MADILIIDDDGMMIEIMTDSLNDDGHSVRSAPDGLTGLAEASRRCPALIILDMNMPGLNGCEVARRLRETETTKRVPILAITGDTSDASRDGALHAGCDAYLGKPLDLRQLTQHVARMSMA